MKGIVQEVALALAMGIAVSLGDAATHPAHAQPPNDPRITDLLQSGKLRVALGLGTAAIAIRNPATGELRGLAVDLGRALAARMGVEFVAVEYPRPGAVLEGLTAGAWDVAFLVMDSERAQQADFAPPHMQSDFTYLVPPGFSLQKAADAGRAGLRIAVPRGDVVDLFLTRRLKHAELVRTETIAAAAQLLRTGEAQAAPRPLLLAESDKLSGSRVLADGFAVIAYAALVPKAHPGRLAYVSEFIEEAKASGRMQRAIDDAGLRGVEVAPAGKPR